MSQTVKMHIQYIDGTAQQFEWDAQPEGTESANIVSHLQKMLHEDNVLLDMGEKLVILQKQNIKSIEITPVPTKLPGTTIHGVRGVE
ncbi:hypothetical protein [Leptolyngbya iicbica]|uniref:Uncharacterized protein n=2 Tax=Cyanophyceae TaxID=3028117 RepID=A0A4Q7EIP8_9CYAN|nr:hypothetical protein [Leptolyngbya sp. LK]RZM82958.1 hypothetical protein DYY88_07105 [Leptolyngbya sp. LK]